MKPGSADSGENANAIGRQDLAAFGKGMVADQIVEQVVTLIGLGKIFLGIIDDVIRPD